MAEARGANKDAGHERGIAAALFEEMDQAEAALGELEQAGFDHESVGMAFPKERRQPDDSPPPDKDAPEKRAVIMAGAPTAGFPGWTMGMAPWVFAGVGPMVVMGSLSLGRREDGPDDLRGLIMSLGLHEDVYGKLEHGFRRGGILVTVKAPGKEAIAASILDRNGGHSLRRKT